MPEQAMFGFLKLFAANLVHDHFRSLRSNKRMPAQGLLEFDDERLAHAGLTVAGGIEQKILLNEIKDLLETRANGAAAERDRQIFWLHHRHGMSAREIASIPSLHLAEKGVESVLGRLAALVKRELTGA